MGLLKCCAFVLVGGIYGWMEGGDGVCVSVKALTRP